MKRVSHILLLLACLAPALALHGRKLPPPTSADETDFFVRIMPDRSELLHGDSILISVVLYAKYPIAKAECTTDFTVKGKGKAKATARKLNINRNATSSRTREKGRTFYTLVWAQYVVCPDRPGEFTIPKQKFKATLQEVVRMPDLFGQMMGVQPEYKEHEVSATSEEFTFQAKEKPRRSTQDIYNSSGNLL